MTSSMAWFSVAMLSITLNIWILMSKLFKSTPMWIVGQRVIFKDGNDFGSGHVEKVIYTNITTRDLSREDGVRREVIILYKVKERDGNIQVLSEDEIRICND